MYTPPPRKNTLNAYWRLMRFDRPIGSLLLLWPTLWALFLATNGLPNLKIIVIFVLGVIFMRAAGCVINDYADRHIDGHVKRTASRPLATGEISANAARTLFIGLILISFILVLQLNGLTILLSFVAAALASIYPFMKRYTHLPQVILGMAFGWSIPMAFTAVSEQLPLSCWLLFAANLAWTIAYDTQYAMVDRDDDLRIGVKSTAILFAEFDNSIVALLQLFSLFLFVVIGVLNSFTFAYYFALIGAAACFIYQCRLTKERLRENCFLAFLNNNWAGFAFFIAILCGIYL